MTFAADEISSIVIDVGQSWTKAGYSGEDAPKYAFPSNVATNGTQRQFAESAQLFREQTDIVNPMKGGLVHDWHTYEALLNFTFREQLRVNPTEMPLMLCEPTHNTAKHREKQAELAFEKFHVPAFYLSKNAVLSAFAAGRSTAMVIDCGAGQTTVAPVYDGYVLAKGILSQELAGNNLSEQVLALMQSAHGNQVPPAFRINKKKQMEMGKSVEPALRKLQHVKPSFDKAGRMLVADAFKESVCSVSDTTFNEQVLASRPRKAYEFPDGFNNNFGAERFRIPEILFDPKQTADQEQQLMSITQMIIKSVETCDMDVRSQLLSNLVLTGGTTLLPNFAERINNDLQRMAPGQRIKLFAAGNSIERRFGNWIGGSMLASLGTFQQLWISKQEWEEEGASILEKRCP